MRVAQDRLDAAVEVQAGVRANARIHQHGGEQVDQVPILAEQ